VKAWSGKFNGMSVKVAYGHGAPVSFTFDDGPSAEFTPHVLALLKADHVPAVFCLIGLQARAQPTLVREEVRAGHKLCDHSRDHDMNMNRKGRAYVKAEVDDGLADIHAAAPGVPVRFYRQPGGFWSPIVVQAMTQAGLHPLRWSDDPRDWSRPGADTIVRRVVRQLRPGAVILMHDGGGDRSQTITALAWLLKALPDAGWKPVLAPEVNLSARAAARPQ
jgi:peptidoglycan/xylan/chitin deacetylase (PgdA/CDA1 family)